MYGYTEHMSPAVKRIFMFLVLVAMFYAFRAPLATNMSWMVRTYLPCRIPITYTVAKFDERFAVTRDEFEKAILEAEAMWEGVLGRELFISDPEGRLEINLLYDYRQDATDKLRALGLSIDDSRASYDALKNEYETLHAEYELRRARYDAAVAAFSAKQEAYNEEVARLNARGGAKRADYERLMAQQQSFASDIEHIRQMEDGLNADIGRLNVLVVVLNRQAAALNLNVEAYNEIGESRGREFDEGIYRVSRDEEAIDIYQFDDRTKLVQVLAHELGHALGLEHSEDEKAIMYRLNQGENKTLADSDIATLRAYCGVGDEQ